MAVDASQRNSPAPDEQSGPADVQVQPCGFLLELSPDWLISRASENSHKFLGEYPARLIGEPLSEFTMAQPLHDLRNLLSRQGATSGIARAYRVRLVDGGNYFDIAFQLIKGRILLEGVPSMQEGFGSALGTVGRLIDGLDRGDGQALLDGAARRVRALTGYDRVTASLTISGEERVAVSSRGNFAPGARPHHIDDLPGMIADTASAPISLFPRLPQDRAASEALLRSPSAHQLQELRDQAIRSTLEVPILLDGEPIGYFECEDRSARPPNLEMHAAVELFAKIFAMRLRLSGA